MSWMWLEKGRKSYALRGEAVTGKIICGSKRCHTIAIVRGFEVPQDYPCVASYSYYCEICRARYRG